jgi:hypothetical protein
MLLLEEEFESGFGGATQALVNVRSAAARTGAYASPSRYQPPIGYGKIDLFLTSTPCRRLFDARSARFQSATNDVLQYFTVSASPMARGVRTICAGLFTVYSHRTTQFWEGLSFGGTVTITSQYEYTHVTIDSPAPIFVLLGVADPVQRLLFDELMAHVARHRAERRESDAEFARRLATTDPYVLFLAVLDSFATMVKHGPSAMNGSLHPEVQRAVQRMIDAVKRADGWPAHITTLNELL